MQPFNQPQPINLLIQQGPSCWMYVVVALATPKIDTSYMHLAMLCYPDSDQVHERHLQEKHTGKGSRACALDLLHENLHGMVTTLQHWRISRDGADRIPLKRAHELGRRNLVTNSAWNHPPLGIVFDGPVGQEATGFDAFLLAFERADTCVKELIKIAAQAPGEEVAALLNTGYQQFDSGQALSDVTAGLSVQEMPCYGSIRARYRLDLEQRQQDAVDLTSEDMSGISETAHAILVLSFTRTGDEDGVIVYKDPNYGNVLISVNVAQFKAMAGDKENVLKLRPFFAAGAKASNLAAALKF